MLPRRCPQLCPSHCRRLSNGAWRRRRKNGTSARAKSARRSRRYKRGAARFDQLGGALGVDYVMEGSARREGTRVRISATLVRASDQTQRWSETFKRDLSGILLLQNDIARGVAQSLALTLLP